MSLIDRRMRPRDEDSWLPQFCTVPVALSTMMLAQVVLVFVYIAPTGRWLASPITLAVGTVFTQWVCVCNLALLCAARSWLRRMPTALAATLGLGAIACVSAAGGLIAVWFDAILALHAIPDGTDPLSFALSIAGMAVLVGAAAFRYYYVTAQWRRGVAANARAQFDALQARIRPHFLFNSMNTIAGLIRTRPADAEAAVEDLSDLFRAALRDDERPSTLEDEIDLVSRYLSIERLRLGERLRVHIEIDPLQPREMPSLLLQPLVENAVLHGIQPLQRGGEIRIAIKQIDAAVRIEIHNPRLPIGPASRGSGTALDNVRRRLDFHYGGSAHMEVDRGPDYYRVIIMLPAP